MEQKRKDTHRVVSAVWLLAMLLLSAIPTGVNGALSQLARLTDGNGGFNRLSGARDVLVKGSVAYLTSFTEHALSIIDVSDPASPQLLAEIVDGQGGFNRLQNAEKVFVSGTTAYVTASTDAALTIMDVSNPSSPTLLKEVVDGVGGFNRLDGADSVFVTNNIAYVTSDHEDSLSVINVSNPANPTLIAELTDGSGNFNRLDGANSVFVSGSTAFVAARNDNGVSIIDVSDPGNPLLLSELVDGVGGFNQLGGARDVFVNGTVAYVVSDVDSALSLIDVSDPSSPRLIKEVIQGQDGYTSLFGALGVHVERSIAYVAAFTGAGLTAIDVSDPANPARLLQSSHGLGAQSIFAGGNLAVLAGSDFVSFFDATSLANTNQSNPSGLVAHYPFDGDANDVSGNGNHATVNNNASLVNDRFGGSNRAYHLDGVDDNIVLPPFRFGSAFTISLWVKHSERTSTQVLFSKKPDSTIESFQLIYNGEGSYRAEVYSGDNQAVGRFAPTTIQNGVWKHIAVSYNGGNIPSSVAIYEQGVRTDAMDYTEGAFSTFNDLLVQSEIGSNLNNGDGTRFKGAVDDVRIYDRALSSAEVTTLFTGGSTPPQATVSIGRAVYLNSSNLAVGKTYQIQSSSDLTNWTNQWAPFVATNQNWESIQYWKTDSTNNLYFRLVQP